METVSQHFVAIECCSTMVDNNNDDNNRNGNNNDDDSAAANESAPNYWKMCLRNRMAVAGRHISAVRCGDPSLDIVSPRRRYSLPITPSSTLFRPLKAITTVVQPTVIEQELLSVLKIPEPVDDFLDAHGPRHMSVNRQCSSSKIFFDIYSVLARVLTMSGDTRPILIFNHRSCMDLRILVSLLLIFTVFPQPVHGCLMKENCRKVGYQHIIDEPGCELVAVYLNRCSGYCNSLSFPDPHQDNRAIAFAKCCRMTDVELINVKMNCGQDGDVRTVKVPSARECECFDCSA